MQALKKFGLGILWAFILPFIVVGVVLVGAFGVPNFFIQFVIMIVNFFRGKKLFPVYPEDQKAYEILQRAIDRKNGELNKEATPAPAPQQVFVQQNFYTNAPTGLPGQQGMPLPPGYTQVPPQPYSQVPPPQDYASVPPPGYPQIQPNPAPQPQPEPIPQRPPLAELPPFDPNMYSKDSDTIEIDVDEGGEDNE